MTKKNNKSKTLKITTAGLLSAVAIALAFTERAAVSLLPLPPGIRPGFSNIVVMLACAFVSFPCALAIALIKSGFVFLVSGGVSGFLSISGGLLSVCVTALLIKISKNKLSYFGISVLGAVAHNIGQLIGASLTVGSTLYLSYAPVLIISGVIFGAVTGIIFNCLAPALKKHFI